MKKKLMAIVGALCMFAAINVFGQTFEGNVSLYSQADVNSFNYTEITGTLDIIGDDITDLSPLNTLTYVGKYIYMGYNPALTEVINGFSGITSVGTGIYIYDNPNLITFDAFHNLISTGDNIDIWYNDSLQTISGFEKLEVAGWTIEIGGNPVLTNIPQYEALHTISSSLFILDNPMLPAITGFNSLQYVDWSFQIVGNDSLNSVCGFYNYFLSNNPYTGNGYYNVDTNGPGLPDPTTEQDIIDDGACKRNNGKKPLFKGKGKGHNK